MKLIFERLEPLVYNENANPWGRRAIFSEIPHITWDNHFSGDVLLDFAAEKKLPLTMTCARNKLPSGVPSKYWHKEQTKADARSRAARWLKPIFAIKQHRGSTLQFCSFQSTSSCNIVSVNAINSMSLFASTKQRGRGTNKRQWGIEMNESRQLYLATYGVVDTIDQMIDNCNMNYRSWKYWHAAMNHGKRLAVVVAYDIYLELASGNVTSEWKVDKPVSFHRFREKLALQMLSYTPTTMKYPGDEKARAVTKKPKAKRSNHLPCSPLCSSPAASIASTDHRCRNSISLSILTCSKCSTVMAETPPKMSS